jgi:predicted transposase/invertase (TIGR01784 family)
MRYLDPKSDLVFKRVFGENANILLSFLNAMLPLEEGQIIKHLEYLPTELNPKVPYEKKSIVDVRCKDNRGWQFIVEMQMLWSKHFISRMIYNTAKTYVKQLVPGEYYDGLKPVYGLALVNEDFEKDTSEFYHHYQMTHQGISTKKIEDLHVIFVEILKFVPKNYKEKKLMVLWMRFMTEIQKDNAMLSEELIQELQSVPEIVQALEIAKESRYTKEELLAYDEFWDALRTEKTLIIDAESRGEERGIQIGEERGIQKGEYQNKIETAKRLKKKGVFSNEDIADITGLTLEEVQRV